MRVYRGEILHRAKRRERLAGLIEGLEVLGLICIMGGFMAYLYILGYAMGAL